jgi:hypothetical protein
MPESIMKKGEDQQHFKNVIMLETYPVRVCPASILILLGLTTAVGSPKFRILALVFPLI